MSDFTGINIDEVTTNLDNFKTEIDSIINDFNTSFTTFNANLWNYWASPKAVEFNTKLINIGNAYNETVINLYEILFAAGSAAAEMAKSNGATFNNQYTDLPKDKLLTQCYGLVSEIDGVTGMNIFRVKWTTDDFKDQMANLVTKLNGLPTTFGLYDPEGLLQSSYTRLIGKTAQVVEAAINDSMAIINDALENETNEITLGMGIALVELGD